MSLKLAAFGSELIDTVKLIQYPGAGRVLPCKLYCICLTVGSATALARRRLSQLESVSVGLASVRGR